MLARQRKIIDLALDYFANYSNELECYMEMEEIDVPFDFPYQVTPGIVVGSNTYLPPTDNELQLILKPGRNGNTRTKEILKIALTHLLLRIDDIQQEYYYYGDNTRYGELMITVNGINMRTPSEEEIQVVLGNLDSIVKRYPSLPFTNRGWNVYDLIEDENGHTEYEWIDKVFFTSNCDRKYIQDSLINHDGYNPSIVVLQENGY